MTESEFQEFLITVGYRYNAKAKSAFNSFEGFHTIIFLNNEENRYALSMGAQCNEISLLNEKLRNFALANKSFVTKAVYKEKKIRISVKMTVDSEIDREHLKETTKFVLELCKSEILTPICSACSRNRKTGLYVIGRELVPVCDSCISRKRRQYEKRKNMFIKKKQNMPAGLMGAVFGASLGTMLYMILYQWNPLFGIWGGAVAALSFAGFVVTGKRATKKSGVICVALSFLIFAAGEYMANVAKTAIYIENEGGGIAVSEAIYQTNTFLSDGDYMKTIILDLAIGLAAMILVGIVYFLKRKYTRPLKISKNVL